MKIIKYGNPLLRKKSKKVDELTDDIKGLIIKMEDTMHEASGAGLAAPQVGILKRVFLTEIAGETKKVINPIILKKSDEDDTKEEGCLSIPGIYSKVKRPLEIKVKYLDETGKEIEEILNGMDARAFLHEFDHLEGVLFVDKVSRLRKKLISKKLKKLARNTKNELKRL
ncbi:MAG: peptide deformylase [Fusobacteriota bacterium]